MDDPLAPLARLAGLIYFLTFLLLFLPFLDLVANLLPLNPAAVNWRYGTLGLTSGFLLTPLLGLVMALTVSSLLEHRGVRITVGILGTLVALGLFLGTMLFILDGLQLRTSVAPESKVQFDVGAAKAAIKLVACAVCFALVAFGAFRRLPPAASKAQKGARPLVVGGAGREAPTA
jgi:hypothetical protein